MSSAPPRPGCGGSTTASSASLTGGLPSLTTNLERGNDGIVHFTNLQLYSPKLRLSGAGQRFTRRHLPHRRRRPAGEIRPGEAGARRPYRAAAGSTCSSTGPTTRSASAAMRLLLDADRRRASIIARAAARGSGRSPATARSCCRTTRPTVIAIAALDAGGAHASGDLRSDPGRLHRPADARQRHARRNARLRAGRRRRSGSTRTSPPTTRTSRALSRCGAAAPTAPSSSPTSAPRSTAVGRRARASTPARSRSRGSPPTPSWSTAAGQVRAAFAGRRGAAFAFSTLADVSPDAIRLTGSGRIERQPLVLNQAAVLTRSGDGWALAPTSLSFAGGTRDRLRAAAARAPEVHAQVQAHAARSARPRLARASTCRGSATGRARLCLEGQPQRPARPQGPRAQPRRAGARVQADRRRRSPRSSTATRRRLRAVAASDGAIVGRAQARFAPLGGGPLVAELMNAPLFAQLRYAGPADTLWRLTGSEVLDMSGPARGRRRHRRPAGRPGDPRLAAHRRTRGSKARSPAWSSTMSRRQARFSGPQLIFSQITGADGGRRVGHRAAASVTFSGGTHRAQPVVQRQPGAAAQSRRRRRAGHRPAADPVRRAGRHDLGRPQARQGPLPARPGERRRRRAAAQGARNAASIPRT